MGIMGKKAKLKRGLQKQNKKKFAGKTGIALKNRKNVKSSAVRVLKQKRGDNVSTNKDVLFSQHAIANELFRLQEDTDDLEEKYENQISRDTSSSTNRLPIKTRQGIIPILETNDDVETNLNEFEDHDLEGDSSSDDYSNGVSGPKVITTTQLFSTQNKLLETARVQVGSLSASILENPNEKIHNFKTLFNLMNGNETEHLVSVKKVIIVSLLEVFKDLLPSYQIKQTLDKSVKLKKETLNLEKYETALLQYYKKFLQILERMFLILVKKRDTALLEVERKLGELSVSTLCDLLYIHPYFNYAENIAQTIVPFLNHSTSSIRQKVNITCKNIFKEDKKGEITLKILRLVNQSLKKNSFRLQPDVLEILLYLNIKDVNLDQERDQKLKQKKLLSHKSNVMQLSKNERKKKARLQELEKSLLEAKAEENKQLKNKCYTEIIKIVFGIFFRILKNSTNTQVVGICLQGIAKFSHAINVEFYVDLINILDNLLKADWLGYTEEQRCMQTIFVILNDQEILNLDPIQFYAKIYEKLLTVHAAKNYDDFSVVLDTLKCSVLKRHKKITIKRMASFLKRITTLSLQLLHNGTLACLGITKSLLQLKKAIDVLLDLESSSGDGPYLPQLIDPEYCNATSTALYELALLNRHYHPTVGRYSRYIAYGAPLAGENNLSAEFGRTSAEELFTAFDMSQMCFYPTIPVVKQVNRKIKLKSHKYCNSHFKRKCTFVLKKRTRTVS